jgi:hypothetical protein
MFGKIGTLKTMPCVDRAFSALQVLRLLSLESLTHVPSLRLPQLFIHDRQRLVCRATKQRNDCESLQVYVSPHTL